MLLALRIVNFALVDRLELEFDRGLNVLTGETGAGKSIVLDAIDTALGGRVSARFVRAGARRAMVEGTFALTSNLQQWLQGQGIDPLEEEGGVVCARELVLGKNGSLRARSRVNGVLVNRHAIAELRSQLVEITAQGQTVALLDAACQRDLLDIYGGAPLLAAKTVVAGACDAARKAQQALDRRRAGDRERLQRLDLLQFQARELEEAALEDASELDDLKQEHDRLLHASELQAQSQRAYQVLYQNDTGNGLAAADLLAEAEGILAGASRHDRDLEAILELVRSAIAQIVEAGQQLGAYGDRLEADPARLQDVESRLHLLKQICRKYGPTLADAIALAGQVRRELAAIADEEGSLEILESQVQECQAALQAACCELSAQRRLAATQLERQLVATLKPLAMDKVQFCCAIAPVAPSARGADAVEFRFSPNPGEALKPLAETASGGEMSRFLLALKTCLVQEQGQPSTLIFDEIDAGVSGRVARAIGDKLKHLASRHQILCVTHQPLIAALADTHFRVQKQIVAVPEDMGDGEAPATVERTLVRVESLNSSDRREELAQLAGGHSAGDALAFADALLAQAAKTGKPPISPSRRTKQPRQPKASV